MNQEQLENWKRIQASKDFSFFIDYVFSESKEILKNGEWTGGVFVDDIASWLENNNQTVRVSARDHFKSMSFYAHIMWKIYRSAFTMESREIQYFSYKESMASYHVAKIKQAIECNPHFSGIIDKKKRAEGVISYQWYTDGPKITVTPRGLLEFKRGIHCNDVYVDDALQDPQNKMILTNITRINDVMKTQILDMYQNELHIVGTAQTQQDFFFDPEFTHRFSVRILPAIKDLDKQIVLWPEWMDWEELQAKKRERGEKVFNQEYLCSPVYSEEAFVSHQKYDSCKNDSLINYSFTQWEAEKLRREAVNEKAEETGSDAPYPETDFVAGFDIGKKAHPSHLAVFEKVGDKLIQRHSKWMDNWDYKDQLAYLQQAIDTFGIYVCYYDNTRGEFEAFDEQGQLPAEMEPVQFTFKAKHAWAANFDKALTNRKVELVNDPRQRNQILIVNNDLQAPETPEGHGDSFWSVCLGLIDSEGAYADVTVL